MTVSTAITDSPSFEPFPNGHRLRCVSAPAHNVARGTVFLAPPFAEEMNKTRRMCARLARLLAADGWRVVRLDLYGCGDSAGELRDATWARWVDDLQIELRLSVEQTGAPVWIWCVRSGALFASDLLELVPSAHLLLWQPVLSGSTHLNQFLRLHSAARLLGRAKAPSVKGTPAQQLAAGNTIEVGGYELPAAIAQGMAGANWKVDSGRGGRIVWLEIGADVATGPSPATVRAVEESRARGHEVQFEMLSGAPFWNSTEIVENEGLLMRSQQLMSAAMAAEVRIDNHAT